MNNLSKRSCPQADDLGETGKLLVVVVNSKNNNNNNNNAARSAASDLSFADGSGLTQAEQEHLVNLLKYHPHGQSIADELAGQLRTRGRGSEGIRNPRALASRLIKEATVHGVGLWYYWPDEAKRRALQPTSVAGPEVRTPASPETIARAKAEMQSIKTRQAAARLSGGGK